MPQRGQRGRGGPGLSLDHKSLDRIDGKAAEEARQLARLSPSQRSSTKGRYDAKWKAVRSALENFIPEVRPGNQTALSTRAHPFALYVARMHRQIHKLWGFGFLEDLDRKPDGNSMNNMQLWTMVEIVVMPDGSVAKATVVRPSGILPYDVAALDTVFSSAPYPPTPRDIRSADGRVYMHWRFHRDHRQCGTFGVDPYILTTPPKGPIDTVAGEVKGDPSAAESRALRQLHRRPAPGARPRPPQHAVQPQAPVTARPNAAAQAAAASRVDARDPAAKAAAESFVRGFREGSAAKMAAACSLPFLAQGKKVAATRAELQRMLGDLLRETRGRGSSPVTVSTVLRRAPRSASCRRARSTAPRCSSATSTWAHKAPVRPFPALRAFAHTLPTQGSPSAAPR
jgi:TonB family protein